MKKFIIILILISCSQLRAQTNVSGGIFSDTTWTKDKSPYIVTGNIVVFPGAKLIIQPGVTVKFSDGVSLEIRQSKLIANGTVFNPIVFTSNNLNPTKGIWDKIYVNQSLDIQIKYCEFHYANKGMTGQSDSLSVVSSYFTNNILGMDAQSNKYVRIDSCIFRNNDTGQSLQPGYSMSITNCTYVKNQTGLYAQSSCSVISCVIDSNSVCGLLKHMACNDTIRNNEIKYNGIGIAHDFSGCGGIVYIKNNQIEDNTIGIQLQNMGGIQQLNIYNNTICSNSTYNIQNETGLSVNAVNNCWCSKDPDYIQSSIYDAHNNISYGIVSYLPIDTLSCTMNIISRINDNKLDVYNIYPNPANDKIIFKTSQTDKQYIELFDINGRSILSEIVYNNSVIDVSTIKDGLYIMRIRSSNQLIIKKVNILH